MKKTHLLTLIALIMMGLLGCEKAKVTNEASADVFVKAIKNASGTTVYAAIHTVFSYNAMKSVSVSSPGGTPLMLTNFENGGNSFFNEPAIADYSATAPASGAYSYIVKFNDGEEITYTNSLATATLLPANITSMVKNATGDSLSVSWDAIAGAHGYQFKFLKGTTQVYFQAAFLENSPVKPSWTAKLPISKLNSSGSGTYTFELTGLLFETTAFDYIQAISTSTKDIAL